MALPDYPLEPDRPPFDQLVLNGAGEPMLGETPPPKFPSFVELDGLDIDIDSIQGVEIGPNGEARPLLDLEDEPEEMPAAGSDEHRKNLAEDLDDELLAEIGHKIVEAVERDIEDRQPWMDRFRRGMELMGLVNRAVDDGPFPGASTVNHPLITEACVQFWARAQGELVPSDGPCKVAIIGEQSEELIERAERVKDYMNHELMHTDKMWYPEMSRALFALPMQGSVFKKSYRDAKTIDVTPESDQEESSSSADGGEKPETDKDS